MTATHEPRVIFYYQTFTSLQPILSSPSPNVTHIHLASIHFGVDEQNEPYIHLNDLPPSHYKFNTVWEELKQATEKKIKVKLMVGGAGGGYSTLFSDFNTYYNLLVELINSKPFISGIDLDIEEECSLENVKKLINCLKNDFGNELTISMAPIQSSLQSDTPGIGGFIYKDLLQSPEGKLIDYFNGQFYEDYSEEAYQAVIKNGYLPEMVVMGAMAAPLKNTLPTIQSCYAKYGKNFGGVFVWEYCFAKPSPAEWGSKMANLLDPRPVITGWAWLDSYLFCIKKILRL
jgi:hypothetical protein